MGTGQNLWTVGQHASLTDDKAWLKSVAPNIGRACRWI